MSHMYIYIFMWIYTHLLYVDLKPCKLQIHPSILQDYVARPAVHGDGFDLDNRATVWVKLGVLPVFSDDDDGSLWCRRPICGRSLKVVFVRYVHECVVVYICRMDIYI